jgi:putative transposase
VRRVAEVLKVWRSQLSERLKSGSKPRIRCRKSEDGELLDPVRRLVDERPTYGYRELNLISLYDSRNLDDSQS